MGRGTGRFQSHAYTVSSLTPLSSLELFKNPTAKSRGEYQVRATASSVDKTVLAIPPQLINA